MRLDEVRQSSSRSAARPTVIGEPERFASTVAPAIAAMVAGGSGTHMSSQISTPSAKSGRSVAAKSMPVPKGTASASFTPGSVISPS